jgi:hypothetical protein
MERVLQWVASHGLDSSVRTRHDQEAAARRERDMGVVAMKTLKESSTTA